MTRRPHLLEHVEELSQSLLRDTNTVIFHFENIALFILMDT